MERATPATIGRAAFDELASLGTGPCVSIFLTMHRTGGIDVRQGRPRLKNLLRAACAAAGCAPPNIAWIFVGFARCQRPSRRALGSHRRRLACGALTQRLRAVAGQLP